MMGRDGHIQRKLLITCIRESNCRKSNKDSGFIVRTKCVPSFVILFQKRIWEKGEERGGDKSDRGEKERVCGSRVCVITVN